MPNQHEIDKAVGILQQGGLIAFPTETVYGLGGDASNAVAIEKIFVAKGRPSDHPVIVHLASVDQLVKWAAEVSDDAKVLAEAFWPGPLTLIFKKCPEVSMLLTGGQDTIGLRVPKHPVARALLKGFGGGVAAPSANRYGRISPTTALAVEEELAGKVDLILDGGQCEVGVESTIVDVSGEEPVLLRPGMISVEKLEAVLGKKISFLRKNVVRVSGMHESHYAPVTPARLITRNDVLSLQVLDCPVVILAHEDLAIEKNGVEIIKMPADPQQYAHNLYATLRECDGSGFKKIFILEVPVSAEWDAIRDRLQRATY